MRRFVALAALLILGGGAIAFANPQLGNSRDRTLLSNQIACGSDRREVKQLLDDDAENVAFGNVIDSTVKRIGNLKRPAETGPTRQKKERRVYRVRVILDSIPPSTTSPGKKLGYKTETNDNDIHLAVRDSTGATMVVEFPNHACTAGAKRRAAMESARAALVKACSKKTPPRDPPQSFVELHGKATITGVLFFDFPHHQRGKAPNTAELHPVLSVTALNCERA
jgi:hypothetical protein